MLLVCERVFGGSRAPAMSTPMVLSLRLRFGFLYLSLILFALFDEAEPAKRCRIYCLCLPLTPAISFLTLVPLCVLRW